MLTTNRTALVRNRDMTAAWRHLDLILIGLVLCTTLYGSLMVYSATRTKEVPLEFIQKHVVFVILGIAAMGATAAIDYTKFRDWARLLYLLAVLGLMGVLTPLGSVHNNIQAWYDIGPIQIQPAEMAKVLVIVAVASYLGTQIEELGLRQCLVSLVMFGIPMALIMLQPDLGTDLVFVVIIMTMLLVAQIPARYLLALILLGLIAVVGIVTSDALGDYQKARLTTFLEDEGTDEASKAARYNTDQAQAAIALGGLWGEGYLEGQYTSGGSVPEQQTDFIFTVAGEEMGLWGSALLLSLFAGIAWRIWRTALLARDQVGTLICAGIFAMFCFHVFENVGMNLGIMPVTGIPLPFVSYGGSATITMFAATGLVLNVHMRRYT